MLILLIFIAEFTVVVTGTIGNGKSAACNFFMKKQAHESRPSLVSVSKEAESGMATIGGKHIELVDTPGFLDPSSVEEDDDRLEFARGLISMTSGFHVLGLVFNLTKRVQRDEDKIYKDLLSTYKHYLPYVVLIFTHGKHIGDTDDEQKSALEDMIEEINQQQKKSNFNQLLKKINYRYIILESVHPMGKGYHAKKSKELVKMIETVVKQTKKPATNSLASSIAENLKKATKVDQKKVEEELADRIKKAQEMAKKDESGGSNFYAYLGYSILIGGGILATVMSGVVPAALAAAAAAAKAAGSIAPWLLAVAGNAALEKAKTCTFQ